MQRRFGKLFSVLALALAFGIGAAELADAKPKTNFGSRGSRTYDAPAPTQTAPNAASPMQRSVTPAQPGASQPGMAGQAAQAARPGFMNGFGGTLLKGLAIGGLLGLLLGHGFGGLAGMLGMLLQVALVAVAVYFVIRLFRRNQSASNPAMASAGQPGYGQRAAYDAQPAGYGLGGGAGGSVPSFGGRGPAAPNGMGPGDEIGITKTDLDSFERLMSSVWTAFSREDEGALRGLATPEVAGYLGEELMNNRTRGLRNEMSDLRLLQGDVSEAWREAGVEYATVAVRYSLRDVTRETASGRIVSGDPDRPVESTEVWTFVRTPGEEWKVSAIQEA